MFLPYMTQMSQNCGSKNSLKMIIQVEKTVNFGFFGSKKKKLKKTTFFRRPPLNEHFMKKRKKWASAPVIQTFRGSKNQVTKGYYLWFFSKNGQKSPKSIIFQNLPIKSKAKKDTFWSIQNPKTSEIEIQIWNPNFQILIFFCPT